MSSPTIHPSTPPSGAQAVEPAGAGDPQQPASRPRRIVGALAGLFRTRGPEAIDLASPLRAGVQVSYGDGAPGTSGTSGAAGLEGVLGDETWARDAVQALFPNIDDAPNHPALLNQMLEPHPLDPRAASAPRYGTAPRYANGLLFANVLAHATGHDWQDAEHVMTAWHAPQTQSDALRSTHFAAHCALARTDSGRDVLDSLGDSPFWRQSSGSGGDDAARLRATLMLAASGELNEHAAALEVPAALLQPRDEHDAARLAQAVLDAAPPDATADVPAAAAHARATIAAHTVLGMAAAEPSADQRAAITLFRGALAGHGVADTAQLARARNRVNRLWGDSATTSWWSRVRGRACTPVSDRRLIGGLMQASIQGMRERLHERLQRPMQEANGRAVPAENVVTNLDDAIVGDAVRYGILTIAAERIDRKGEFHDTVRLCSGPEGHRLMPGTARPSKAERRALQEAAALLGVRAEELREHPAWRAGWDSIGTEGELRRPGAFSASDLTAYMDREGLAADDPLRRPVQAAEALRAQFADRNDAMRTLVETMRPGSRIAFTSQGVLGVNTTWWGTFGLNALSNWPVIPTVCPLPTVARTRGRGAAVVLSGDEGPEGGYVDIHSGTFDRKQLTGLLGVIAQAHDHGNHNFAWVIGETGGHRHDESYEGVTIRVSGRDFAEAKARACTVIDAMARPPGGDGASPWQRLADHGHLDPHVLVGSDTRHTEARTRIKLQVTGLIGQDLPIASAVGLPATSWVAPAVSYSRTSGSELTTSRGLDEVVNPQFRRERHITPAGLNFPLPVFFQLGALANQIAISGGHGAHFIPLARFGKTLEHREATLVLPGPGVESAPYREFTMDEETWQRWSADVGGEAQPRPPAYARRESLPDAGAARGARTFVMRQYLTPAALAQLRKSQDLAATTSALDPFSQDPAQPWNHMTGELLLSESSWGVAETFDQHTTGGGRVGGPPPWLIQAQAPQAIERRERRHIGGRQGGRPEPAGARDLPRQLVNPQRWVPVAEGVRMSPTQHTIAQIFEHLPQNLRIESERIPTHADQFGLLFNLVDERNRVYPEGSPSRSALDAFLGGTQGQAFAQAVPRHPPQAIMQDFVREAEDYRMRHARTSHERSAPIEDLPETFWRELDIAAFVERHFTPPEGQLPAPNTVHSIAGTLLEHIARPRPAGALVRGSEARGVMPMPESTYRDRLANAQSLIAAGDVEGAWRLLEGTADEVRRFGFESNGLRMHHLGQEEAQAFALTAERCAEASGDEARLAGLSDFMLASWRAVMDGADDQLVPGRHYNQLVMLDDGRLLNMRDDGAGEASRSVSLEQNAQMAEWEYVLTRALRASGDSDLAGLMHTWHIQRLQTMRDVFFAPAAGTQPLLAEHGASRYGEPLMAGSQFHVGAGPEGTGGALHPQLTGEVANALWVRGLAPQEALDNLAQALERDLLGEHGLRASPGAPAEEEAYRAADAYKAVMGLLRHQRYTAAERIAARFSENARQAYANHGVTFERYGPQGQPGRGFGERAVNTTDEALQFFALTFPSVREILERPVP